MAQTSPYDSITPESLKASMLADLAVQGTEVDTREGSYANILVSVAAYQMFKLYQQFPSLLSMAFPDDTAGEYLDKNASQIGLTRHTGEKAAATVIFNGTDGTEISAGTALYAPASGLKFLTTADATILGGTASATAEAEDIGTEYNLGAGTITSMYVNVAGITGITNPAAAAGGVDEESDADFYTRYHERRTLPITSGNKNHYIQWARETTGVSYASCIPLWNGNGTVKVIIAGADRGPVDEEIRAACVEYIEENRPIGADVTVVSVTERAIPLTAAVTLSDGYTTAQIVNQLTAAVSEMLANQAFGTSVTIPYSRFLACLLSCAGVADYSAMTADGGTAAITVAAETVPVVGTVTVTETGA